jgi:hypothetical protein
MNIENARQKLSFPKENKKYQGRFCASPIDNLFNPSITFFRNNKQQKSTNFISFPTVIINKLNIDLDKTRGDVMNQLVISLCKKGDFDCVDELQKIIIKIKYGECLVVDYSLFHILNIYKMFPEYYDYTLTNKINDEQTYNININLITNLLIFELNKGINIEIIGIDEQQIHTEIFFDSYILTKMEYDRFCSTVHEEELYQYKITQHKNNQEIKIELSNNVIIDKLLVCGDYTHNVTYKDEEIEINLINNNSSYNKYHKLCAQGNNSFFYFCNSPVKIPDAHHMYSGKLFPSISKTIKFEGCEEETSTLYIQHCNLLIMQDLSVKLFY